MTDQPSASPFPTIEVAGSRGSVSQVVARETARGRVVVVDTASTVRLASAARASYPGLVATFAIAIADAAAAGTWPGLTS